MYMHTAAQKVGEIYHLGESHKKYGSFKTTFFIIVSSYYKIVMYVKN